MALEEMSLDNKIALCKEAIEKFTQKLAELEKEKQNEQHTRFIPNINEHYAYISCDGVKDAICIASSFDSDLICFNNTFRPSSAVNLEKYLSDVIRVQNRLMQLHEELCPEYEPKWDGEHLAAAIVFDIRCNRWDYQCTSLYNYHTVGFSYDAAEKACEILNKEKFMMDEG